MNDVTLRQKNAKVTNVLKGVLSCTTLLYFYGS